MPRLLQKGEGEEPNALAGWLPTRSRAAREDNDVSTKPHGARLEAVPVCKSNQGLEELTNRVEYWGARRLTEYRRFVTGNSQLERAFQLTPTFKYDACKARGCGSRFEFDTSIVKQVRRRDSHWPMVLAIFVLAE